MTHYNLVECEDGRAYIVRSGEGVSLVSPKEGYFFGWAEGAPCGSTDAPPLPPSEQPIPAKRGSLDKDRPLDFSRIQQQSL